MENTREISIFIDESGSFGLADRFSRFYILCMVFHDQSEDITEQVLRLDQSLEKIGLPTGHCIHAGPLIRREKEYAGMDRELRRLILSKMMSFVRHVNATYHCFKLDRYFDDRAEAIHDTFLRQIIAFLVNNIVDFDRFDKIKIYYDNGQPQISALLHEAFAMFSSKVEFVENVTPAKYKLFQFADAACTLELAAAKLEVNNRLSASEKSFFEGERNFKRNFLKAILRKRYK